MNQEEIVRRCRKNDRAAQALLFKWLAPQLLGLCVRYLQDRAEAEDAMQESFIKIFTSLHTFKGEGNFEGWCKRIAVNTALNALKKKNRIFFERNLQLVENTDFTEEEATEISVAEIMNCMNALPSGYRTIINLCMVEEFSHREIAEKLNISESTSRSQYARARQALVKLLKKKKITQAQKAE